MFDIRYLLDNESITEEIKEGFLLCLLGSSRPANELIFPNLLDQRKTMDNQFGGMTIEPFSYEDYERTRQELIEIIQKCLTGRDKDFLVGFNDVLPDWSIYDFQHFPSIQWKLLNLEKLKSNNPEKHKKQLDVLKRKLSL